MPQSTPQARTSCSPRPSGFPDPARRAASPVLSFFFFFSSRRRHTRWNCDWSSDVCSSDLRERSRLEWDRQHVLLAIATLVSVTPTFAQAPKVDHSYVGSGTLRRVRGQDRLVFDRKSEPGMFFEIGRASCRERG